MMQHPLDTCITKSVFDVLFFKVGPTWGRKMVKGYMASGGITAGDKRVGRALSVVSPLYQVQRNSNTARQTPFLTMLTILVTSCTWTKMRNWQCMV